jgi:hypothetical protein
MFTCAHKSLSSGIDDFRSFLTAPAKYWHYFSVYRIKTTHCMRQPLFFSLIAGLCLLSSCKKEDEAGTAKINFIFKFDSTQTRLNNLGQPAALAPGHAAQSPRFNSMSAHYLELAPGATTLLGNGAILYRAPEVSTGGSMAIEFSKASITGNNQTFLSIPLNSIAAGSYTWLRLSLAYQNYDIQLNALGQRLNATVASFIGFNTYIGSHKIKDSTLTVNGNRPQGYWALETSNGTTGIVRSGQAPPGATTVPNPLFATSPVPAGSCVVTGSFTSPLVITGAETQDINIVVSLSTNKSFEWIDVDGNGSFDPLNGDQVVDMGIRGMLLTRL